MDGLAAMFHVKHCRRQEDQAGSEPGTEGDAATSNRPPFEWLRAASEQRSVRCQTGNFHGASCLLRSIRSIPPERR
jgi:hypothetical protein